MPSKSYVDAMRALQEKVRGLESKLQAKEKEVDELNNFWEEKLQILLEESERLKMNEQESSIIVQNLKNELIKESQLKRKSIFSNEKLSNEVSELKEELERSRELKEKYENECKAHIEKYQKIESDYQNSLESMKLYSSETEEQKRKQEELEGLNKKNSAELKSANQLNSKYIL